MRETPNPEINASGTDPTTGVTQGIAAVMIEGKIAGEIPSVYLSNRKTTTHFKERGIFIHSTENCQLTLTFISRTVSLKLKLIRIVYSTSKKLNQVRPLRSFILIIQGGVYHPKPLQITQQNSSFKCLSL